MSINVEDDGQKQKKMSNYLILNILGPLTLEHQILLGHL